MIEISNLDQTNTQKNNIFSSNSYNLTYKWSKVEGGSLLSEPEWGVLPLLVLVARKFGCNGTLLAHTASDGTLEHCEMEHCFLPMEHFDTACTVRLFSVSIV